MLTSDQVRSFEENGYLVIPSAIDGNCLERIRSEYCELLNDLYQSWYELNLVESDPAGLSFWQQLQIAYEAGCDWFQPMDISLPGDEIAPNTPMHFGPAVFNLLTHKNILEIVASLIGSEITSTPIQHVRIKPPSQLLAKDEVRAHITKTDWHQDKGVALEEADKTKMITVWIAITDATEKNGCLKVIPGAHKQMLPHCAKTQTAIADGFIDEKEAIPVPIESGGIVLLHPLIPHASLPNMTDGFRWSFDLRYNVTGQPTGRAHFPDFIALSQSHPDTELKDWKMWRQKWRDARQKLSNTKHIPIHRWQSNAPFCA